MLQLQKRSLLGGCHSSAPFFVIPVLDTGMTGEGGYFHDIIIK
ncbi:hypothetical protein [Wolbachia endosymbiont (group A) of Agelastica alni]